MKTKILFILHMPPPVHGAAMVGEYIFKSNLINKKFDCTFINLSTSENIKEIGKIRFRKICDFVNLIISIFKKNHEINPNIVYITPNAKGLAFYKDFIIVLLLKLLRSNIILHYHNKGVAINSRNIINHYLYKIFFNNTKVILLSKSLYNDINKYINQKNVFYCPNGIPETANISKQNDGEIINLLFLSNLLISKGIYILLDALKVLKEKGYSFKCNFIGGESKEINREIFEYEVNKRRLTDFVKYRGKLYNKEKEFYFKKADIFLLPTFNDCFPLVLLEAMQFSLPCIASIEGGIPDIIDDKSTGYLIEKGNTRMLVEKIEILLNNKELIKHMGIAAYNKYQAHYTINQFENKFANIIEQINNLYNVK